MEVAIDRRSLERSFPREVAISRRDGLRRIGFRSLDGPAEVFLYQGKDHLIRQRETLDDLLKNQIEISF